MLLGAMAFHSHPKQILDVGTGSGLIALMLAQRYPRSQVTGIELHGPSAEQARENAASSPFADRLQILHGDFLEYSFGQQFELIVSNPPFFRGNTSTGNPQRDRARHEEFLPQGKFLAKAASLLEPGGILAVILPRKEAQNFRETAAAPDIGLKLHHCTRIYGTPNAEDKRWLLQLGTEDRQVEEMDFTFRKKDGSYTEGYRELTREFHPHI